MQPSFYGPRVILESGPISNVLVALGRISASARTKLQYPSLGQLFCYQSILSVISPISGFLQMTTSAGAKKPL